MITVICLVWGVTILAGAMAAVIEPRCQVDGADLERLDFLRRLDASEAVEVTDWEAGFIESFLESPRLMTPAQRATVDGMMADYEDKL
jgi:hypothetical protein